MNEPDPNQFDLWIDPTALTIICCVGLVVAGLVALVAITSWANVRIAQATQEDPRRAKAAAQPRDRPSRGEVVDKVELHGVLDRGGPTS